MKGDVILHYFRRFSTLFLLGAVLYPGIEFLYRGNSHISMSFLGGICLVSIDSVHLLLGRVRTVWKAAVSALIITQLEFLTGMLVNVKLGLGVWDYSHLPFQVAGQICLLFSFYWFLLSYLALSLLSVFDRFRKRKREGRKPKQKRKDLS